MNPAEAAELVSLNFSLLPLKIDGTKAPAMKSWKTLQSVPPAEEELHRWGSNFAAGIITGRVSGNLEIIDIDDAKWLPDYLEQLEAFGGLDIWNRLTVAVTPRPGYHLYYRCNEVTIPGNQKLAYDEAETGQKKLPKTKIETRGEGGYVVAPGSPAEVHENKTPYKIIQGTLAGIPIITAEERELLLQAARSLTRWVSPNATEFQIIRDPNRGAPGTRPGDAFNDRVDWGSILKPHGWIITKSYGGQLYWRPPQKENKGHSATTSYGGNDILYVFSSNAYPFEPMKGYTKFTAYCLLNHGGDFSSAAKALLKDGFGIIAPKIADADITGVIPPEAPLPGDGTLLEFTDWNHGKRFAKDWQHCLKHVPKLGWCYWENGIWKPDAHAHATEFAKVTAQRFYNSIDEAPLEKRQLMAKAAKKLHSVTGMAQMLTMASTERGILGQFDRFDGDEYNNFLNCQNVVVDLNTGEPLDHSPDFLITKQAGTNFDHKAVCPLFDECLKMWFEGDSEMIDFFWRWVGYTLTGFTHYEHFVFLEGPGGNGKTIARETILKLMGTYTRALPKSALMMGPIDQTPNITRTLNARMIAVSEVNKGDRLDEGRVKDLVSGEVQGGKILYQNAFDFKPCGKVWMHGNHRPTITDTTESIWRRLLVVPFYTIIPEDKRDPGLRYKTLQELPGILNKAIEGWQRCANRPSFFKPGRVINTGKDYRDEMDSVKMFLTECAEEKPLEGSSMRCSLLYEIYHAWALRSGKKVLSSDNFAREMTRKGYERKKERGSWAYLRIMVKPQYMTSQGQ